MTRERDIFAAVVVAGLALTGCSCPTEPSSDAGSGDAGSGDGQLADASTEMDASDGEISTEDAGEDAMVLIL